MIDTYWSIPEADREIFASQNKKTFETLCAIDNGTLPEEKWPAWLKTLKSLDLNGTGIEATTLPESIGLLSNLQYLDLGRLPVTELPESFGLLTKLEILDLSRTRITKLPESFCHLSSLQELDLSGTRITALPESFGKLESLQSLDLSHTNITALPESFRKLENLQNLDLHNTVLASLPPSFGQRSCLEILNLRNTPITSLPESYGNLLCLQFLDCRNTRITSLPKGLALGPLSIIDKDSVVMPGIYAYGTDLPIEYFAGKEVLAKYLEEGEKQRFREAKLIFLGDGNAGKTFTVTRFRRDGEPEPAEGPPYSPGQTHGVMPHDYPVPGKDFTLHLWDFGGQEMFHAMHRCFLTRNTVYVLMVSTRDSEHTRRLRYWLHGIRSFARGSTVTIIVNVFDGDGRADVDETGLKYEFQNDLVLKFREISAKNVSKEKFQSEVMEPLIALAEQADESFGLHPAAYMRVKDQIRQALHTAYQEENRGYIAAEDYIRYCKEENITDPREQAALLRYFTELGVCFSTVRQEDESVPQDCRLIEPVWLTNALYAIIEECTPTRGWVGMDIIEHCLGSAPGKGRSAGYVRVEPKLRYDSDDCAYVLRVAEQFSLVYRDPEEPDAVFLPAMCNYLDRPAHIDRPADPAFRVVYEIEYSYLPETVVQRLMVECLLAGYRLSVCWRGGFWLEILNCFGVVETSENDRALRIDLWSTSEEQPVRFLLHWFRSRLGLPDRDKKEYILFNGERFSVRRLINFEDNGLHKVAGDTGPAVDISMLLGSFRFEPRDLTAIRNDDPWLFFRMIHPNFTNTFEYLCYEFFQKEYFDENTYPNMPRNYPGVEAIVTNSEKAGRPVGFQSKFSESLSDSLYTIIKKSAEKAIEKYKGKKGIFVLYCNLDLNEDNQKLQEIANLLKKHDIELKSTFGRAFWTMLNDKYPVLVNKYFSF